MSVLAKSCWSLCLNYKRECCSLRQKKQIGHFRRETTLKSPPPPQKKNNRRVPPGNHCMALFKVPMEIWSVRWAQVEHSCEGKWGTNFDMLVQLSNFNHVLLFLGPPQWGTLLVLWSHYHWAGIRPLTKIRPLRASDWDSTLRASAAGHSSAVKGTMKLIIEIWMGTLGI